LYPFGKNRVRQKPNTMPLEFALSPSSLHIKAVCKIFELPSTSGFDEVPSITPAETNKLIQADQNAFVRFKWVESGIFVNFLGGGKWKCEVIFEEMGSGETAFNPSALVNDPGKPGNKFQVDVQIPKGSLDPGLYRVICCMQWQFANGQNGPIVLFDDLGIIKVYKEL